MGVHAGRCGCVQQGAPASTFGAHTHAAHTAGGPWGGGTTRSPCGLQRDMPAPPRRSSCAPWPPARSPGLRGWQGCTAPRTGRHWRGRRSAGASGPGRVRERRRQRQRQQPTPFTLAARRCEGLVGEVVRSPPSAATVRLLDDMSDAVGACGALQPLLLPLLLLLRARGKGGWRHPPMPHPCPRPRPQNARPPHTRAAVPGA